MADNAQDVLDLEFKYLGSTDGPSIVRKYNQITGAGIPESAPWCAMFQTVNLREAGVPEESVLNFKGCATAAEWFRCQNRWLPRGNRPHVGDLCLYDWDPTAANGADHVGMVYKINGDTIIVLEGNSGDEGIVRLRTIPYNWAYISGFGVPLYNTEVKPASDSHVHYQVYATEDKWLPEVTDYNDTDNFGYAGDKEYACAIQGIKIHASDRDVWYRSHTIKTIGENESGSWLDEVKNCDSPAPNDYSGIYGVNIDCLQMRVSKGHIRYRVTLQNGYQCEWVTTGQEYGSTKDDNSYAGYYGEPIMAIQIEITD
jgi:hypothetical protein